MTLFELLGLLRKRLRLIILLPVLSCLVVAIGSRFIPNQYTTSTTMYVLSRNDAENKDEQVTASELSLGSMISSDVSTILTSTRVRKDVAEQLGLGSLAGYSLSVNNANSARVITLSVTGGDPQKVADVANALVADTSKVAAEVMDIEAVNVIDEAPVPGGPSGPNRRLYAMVGLMAGFFAAVCIVVIEDMLDTRIRSGADIEDLVDIPVVGNFPIVER